MVTPSPDISIVMIVYKQRKDWFLACLDSIVAQSCNPEIIVSGVTGDPAEKWVKVFPGVRWVGNPTPDCKVQINNGIEHSSGTFVSHVGSDDWYFPKSIETMLDVAHKRDAVIVYPGLHYCDENLNLIYEWNPPKEFSLKKLKQNCFMTDSSLVRRDILQEFGLFDPAWRKFAIWDMWFKIADKYSGRIFPSNHILCKYRRHKKALGIQAFHGDSEVTGEGLRASFFEKYGITDPTEIKYINGEIITIWT